MSGLTGINGHHVQRVVEEEKDQQLEPLKFQHRTAAKSVVVFQNWRLFAIPICAKVVY